MADYDLGTAHGRIVIDYDDKGTKATEKGLDDIRAKATGLMRSFGNMSRQWRQQGQSMASTAVNILASVTLLTGGVGNLGVAFGRVPKGMEGFPAIIRRVVQLNAAVLVLTGGLRLLARATAGLRGIRVVTGLLGAFGGLITGLTGPLRLVSKLAFNVVTVLSAFRVVKAIIPIVSALNSVISILGITSLGAAHLISGLITAIQDLSGAALLLPAALSTAGLVLLTFKIGLLGVGDALKAMDDPEKFAEALKKLAPAAQEFAKSIKRINDSGFKQLKLEVQTRLFEGLGAKVEILANKHMKTLNLATRRVATSFNLAAHQILLTMTTGRTSSEITTLFNRMAGTVHYLTKAFRPLFEAFITLSNVGSKVLKELSKGAGGAAERFKNFIQAAADDGRLEAWINRGIQALKDLFAIIVSVGRSLRLIFQGLSGNDGKTFLATVRGAAEAFEAFLKSAEGQATLALMADALQRIYDRAKALWDVFQKEVVPVLREFKPVVDAVSTAITEGLVIAIQILSPLFMALAKVMAFLAPITQPILTALVAMVTVIIGLGIFLKILSLQILILKAGLLGLKAAWVVAAFGARLLTGNLRVTELALIKFVLRMIWAAVTSVAKWIWAKVVIIAQWLAMAFWAVVHAIKVSVVWVAQTIATTARMIVAWAIARAIIIGHWIAMAAAAMMNAIRMAAAWFIALGPVGWAIALILLIAAIIIMNWDKISAWTSKTFGEIARVVNEKIEAAKRFVKEAIDNIVWFFQGGWRDVVRDAWNAWKRFTDAAERGLDDVVAEVRSWPGKALAALGNLGSMLYNAGKTIIEGFLKGLKAAWEAVMGFIGGIGDWIAANKGPLSYDRRLLVPAGNAIVRGLAKGMAQSMPLVAAMVDQLNGTVAGVGGMSGKFNLSGTGTSIPRTGLGSGRVVGGDGAAAGSMTIGQVVIPAKDIAEMKNVVEFFGAVKQQARAGKARG